MASNRHIPAPVAREVRQRCGFCCVLCGQPIVEYEHMIPFADVQEHNASDITLLCSQCHRKKTSGLISVDAIREADQNPYMKSCEKSAPEMFSYPNNLPYLLEVGSCGLMIAHPHVNEIDAIVIDSVSFLKLKNDKGRLLLSIAVTDRMGRPLVVIIDNVLQVYPDAWDIVFQGTTLEVRQDPIGTRPFCRLNVNPEGVFIDRWETTHNGKTIRVRDDGGVSLEPDGGEISRCFKSIYPPLDTQGNPIGPPVSAVGVIHDGLGLRW